METPASHLDHPVAKAAHSPALLKHMLAGFGAFERSSLSMLERELIAFSVAFAMGCSYCMAMHSALLAREPEAPAGFVDARRRDSALDDPRLEALRLFVRELIEKPARLF